MHNSVKIAMVFTGTVIGAGFASGQEIYQYFGIYGVKGLVGLAFSCLLFGLLCGMILTKVAASKAYHLETYFGRRLRFVPLLITLYMAVSFCAMVTAVGELFEEQLALPRVWGLLLMCICCYVVLIRGVDGVVYANAVLTPLIIVGILALGIAAAYTQSQPVFACMSGGGFLWSAVLYASYNALTMVVVLTGIGGLADSKRTAVRAAAAGSLILLAVAGALWYILYCYDVSAFQLPILAAAERVHQLWKWLYMPVLAAAMFTTAVSSGFGVLTQVRCGSRRAALLLCAVALLSGMLRFSFIVKYVYGTFGYAGILVAGYIVYDFFKFKKLCK